MDAEAMIDVLDRHMRAELDADIPALMDTLSKHPVWMFPDGATMFDGRDAIREHYEELLVAGRYDAKRKLTWVDPERGDAVSEYDITINFPNGNSVTFQALQLVEFEDGRLRTERIFAAVDTQELIEDNGGLPPASQS